MTTVNVSVQNVERRPANSFVFAETPVNTAFSSNNAGCGSAGWASEFPKAEPESTRSHLVPQRSDEEWTRSDEEPANSRQERPRSRQESMRSHEERLRSHEASAGSDEESARSGSSCGSGWSAAFAGRWQPRIRICHF